MSGFFKGFFFAFSGLKEAIKKGRNLKIHFSLALIAIMAAFLLTITVTEWLILILTIVAVLAAEIFNSALEALCDLIKEENHLGYERTGFIRDASAGAVLILSLGAVLIGSLIFLPYLR